MLRVCKKCRGEFLLEFEGDNHQLCPDCRPGKFNKTQEETDTMEYQRSSLPRRLRAGYKILKGDGDDE